MAKSSTPFCLDGQFQGFAAGKSSPFQYLELVVGANYYQVKLGKDLQLMLFRYLQPGDWVRIVGKQKAAADGPQLKAREVVRLSQPPTHPTVQVAAKAAPKTAKTRARVLVCQKSSCRKRGAEAVCARLNSALAQAGLQDQVTIQGTGCMDRCKSGPQVVVMPDKTRYSRVSPEEVPALVERHFHAAAAE